MAKKNILEKNDKKIPARNYFIVFVIAVLTVALVMYIRTFIISYRENISSVSIFKDNVQSINVSDLDFTIPEAGEVVLYVSYTGNLKINSMEKILYKKIEDKNVKDKIIYLDVSEYLDNNEYINILKKKFTKVESQINTAPLFIYVKDGVPEEAMSSELKMIDYKVLYKLLEKYDIE